MLQRTKFGLNVWYDTTLADNYGSKQFVESKSTNDDQNTGYMQDICTISSLFVVLDRELQVTGHNTSLLVIASGVPSEFEDLSSKVLEDRGKID